MNTGPVPVMSLTMALLQHFSTARFYNVLFWLYIIPGNYLAFISGKKNIGITLVSDQFLVNSQVRQA